MTIVTRYDGTRLDEVVASNAHVHLEQMSDTCYALIIGTATERACYSISSVNGKAWIRATESWREPINRRSEAARRREARKRERTP